MTHEPQEPHGQAGPQPGQPGGQPPMPPQQPGTPGQFGNPGQFGGESRPAQGWQGQAAQQPAAQSQPGQPQPGQPQTSQPQWGQPQTGQPQWGQYTQQPQQPAPQPGQPQTGQPQWGQYAQQQPQWGQYGQPAQQYSGQPQYPGQPQPGGYNAYMAPPKPGVIPLRPLGLGEILDGAFQAARRNGKAMFGSAMIFQLVSVAATLLAMFLSMGGLMSGIMDGTLTFEGNDAADVDAVMGAIGVFSVSILVATFLATMLQMVLQGALVIPVVRAVLNRKTTFGQMWSLAKPRIGTLLLLALMYAVAVLVAMVVYAGIVVVLIISLGNTGSDSGALAAVGLSLLFSLPFLAAGAWIATKLVVAPAAIVVENIGAFEAMRRSWQLTRQNWWRTFGTTLLAAVIAAVIGGVITTPVSFIVGLVMGMMSVEATPDQMIMQTIIAQVISAAIGALVGAVTLAFQTGVMALIYVDLRMRRDGFDVTLLKESETGKDDGGIPGSPSPAALVPGAYATGAYGTGPAAGSAQPPGSH